MHGPVVYVRMHANIDNVVCPQNLTDNLGFWIMAPTPLNATRKKRFHLTKMCSVKRMLFTICGYDQLYVTYQFYVGVHILYAATLALKIILDNITLPQDIATRRLLLAS